VLGFFLIIYFLLACMVVWVALFPEGRLFAAELLQSTSRAWKKLERSGSGISGKTQFFVRSAFGALDTFAGSVQRWIFIHKWAVAASVLLLTVPPAAIVLFSSGIYLDGFTGDRTQINPQVAALLNGEQLAPPAPLPPEIFVTAEVEQVRPMLQSASRNWQLLDADFAQRMLLIFKIMREKHGYEMAILEGYRSPERQDMLARMGMQVTNAKAFQSYHQYGMAADCAFLRDGKLVISERDPWAMRGYALYGEVAESVGLHWGGRWKMLDFGHIELRRPGTIK
jgi:peptidoglycan LD-endopeptidase CwlK